MNKLLLQVVFILLFTASMGKLVAQNQSFINYQASLKGSDNKPVTDQNVTVTVSLYKDMNPNDSNVVYIETHKDISIKNGLINLEIGRGSKSPFAPTFASIKWNIEKPYYVRVDYPELRISGQLKQLGSVPYALTAGSSEWKNRGDTISYSLKRIGIGTDFPEQPLTIAGNTSGVNIAAQLGIQTLLNPNSRLYMGYHPTKNYGSIQALTEGVTYRNLILNAEGGNVGIGVNNPLDKLHIQGSLRQSVGNDFVYHLFSNQNRTKYFELSPEGDFYLYDKNSQFYNMIFRVNGDANIGNAMTLVKANGNVGIGTSNPDRRLHINDGDLKITNNGKSGTIEIATNFQAINRRNPDGIMYYEIAGQEYHMFGGDIIGDASIRNVGTDQYKWNNIYASGTTKTGVLEITGGGDITEKAKNTEGVQAGEVVVIDPTQPNQVKRSQKAYDKTVVGVVSGAGGIKHGMQLAQEGMLDGNTNFAIAGRVYVKVTGKVKVGDLLTTSDKAGYAMAVKSMKKAFGSTIGKALSEPNAEGLVLMLVMMR
jgi:hypothetical protein